jgi:drug/metabolite transporter (DMT)-like permease
MDFPKLLLQGVLAFLVFLALFLTMEFLQKALGLFISSLVILLTVIGYNRFLFKNRNRDTRAKTGIIIALSGGVMMITAGRNFNKEAEIFVIIAFVFSFATTVYGVLISTDNSKDKNEEK